MITMKHQKSKRCHNIQSSGTDFRIPYKFENFEYIWCIHMNTRILSVPENFENCQHIWWLHPDPLVLSDLGIDVNAPNVFKIFGYSRNLGIGISGY